MPTESGEQRLVSSATDRFSRYGTVTESRAPLLARSATYRSLTFSMLLESPVRHLACSALDPSSTSRMHAAGRALHSPSMPPGRASAWAPPTQSPTQHLPCVPRGLS